MKRKLLCIVLSLLLLFSIPGFSLAYTDLSGNDNHSAKLIASRDIDDGDEGDKDDEDDADDNEEDEEDSDEDEDDEDRDNEDRDNDEDENSDEDEDMDEDESDEEIVDETKLYTREELDQAEIEEFGKTLEEIGQEIGRQYQSGSSGGIGVMWTSDTSYYETAASTHRWITWKAKIILQKDGKTNWYNQVNTYSTNLYKGSDDGDLEGKTDRPPMDRHFYHPDLDCSLSGGARTAATELERHYDSAVKYWKSGKKSDAMYELGKALHYLQDCNAPHHAALVPLGGGHATFEQYANSNKDKYVCTSGGKYNWESDPYDWGDSAAAYAIDYFYTDQGKWASATEKTLTMAQKTSAGLIGEFFEDVGVKAK